MPNLWFPRWFDAVWCAFLFVSDRMRSFLYLLLAVPLALAFSNPAQAQNGVSNAPPLSQGVVEVAAFEVAPVIPNGTGARANGDKRTVETRVLAGESWLDLFKRIATTFEFDPFASPELPGQIRLLPILLPGKFLRARAPVSNGPAVIEYVVKPDEAYTISVDGNTLHVEPRVYDPRLIERMRADPAKASLFTATDAIGLPESIALQLTEIFAGEVDFLRELHQGYRCAIVYEAHYREGFIERSGRILAAELTVGARRYNAYYAEDANGRGAYFNESGKSTRKLFRRLPVEFTRVTSEFTLARFHPILGVWRAHRGVDYAAPAGSKVVAVADGVVESVGPRSEYGNLVVLRHYDMFMTYYAHLSGFAHGITPGSRVEQGQVIGYVGMTGLATGPHLHFEFHTKDAAGNWIAAPAPDTVETTILAPAGFSGVVRDYRSRLTVAEKAKFVILD